MHILLRVLAMLAIPVALLGALITAKAGSMLYMVTIQGVAPGDPIWLDELAPPVSDASFWLAIGVGLVSGSLLLRAIVRRRLRQPRVRP
jgi:hypothetical protein